MRKIVISFCILLAALSLKAQTVSGIRIDGGDTPILVYFGGNQMCLPTTTCFVANLKSGYYTVEVYQDKDNTILVQADSNFKLFEKTQYTVDFDQVLTKADVSIRWTTLMGSTEATQDDELAIADISLSHGGTVFSEKKINFVTKAIDIVVDGIEKNT